METLSLYSIKAKNGGGGGSSNYNDLTNKPKINNVELTGNKTSQDLGLLDVSNLNTYEYVFSNGDSSLDGTVKRG